MLTLLTESVGRVSALARAARKSRRRFGGSLEPMHTLRVQLDERDGVELLTLKEASIDCARHHLVSALSRLEAAGRGLGWVRRSAPAHSAEPETWRATIDLLDRLDDKDGLVQPDVHLAEFGLRLLRATGWGLDLETCVQCGKKCEPTQAAMVEAARGGLVCRSCGGARRKMGGEQRARLAAASRGESGALRADEATLAMALVEDALRAHAGLEMTAR